ncbi:MAG: cytidine deaminase [Bacillota bacterium]|nr:cytidine deaminase [Bacillota bacterium]
MEQKLIKLALKAKENAYTPYSKFNVGAALLTESGEIFTGCNVENASYGLANCAERTAIFKAVSEGHTKFQKIAVVTDIEDFASPCGACRQVMVEFGLDIEVLMGNNSGKFYSKTSGELLPCSFTSEQLDKNTTG